MLFTIDVVYIIIRLFWVIFFIFHFHLLNDRKQNHEKKKLTIMNVAVKCVSVWRLNEKEREKILNKRNCFTFYWYNHAMNTRQFLFFFCSFSDFSLHSTHWPHLYVFFFFLFFFPKEKSFEIEFQFCFL